MSGWRIVAIVVLVIVGGLTLRALLRHASTTAGPSSPMSGPTTRTTPPPAVEVLTFLPELRGQERTTVRLHPHSADDGDLRASKMGGRFLWPADEPWPTCAEHHDQPYVGVLQIRRDDVPELGFPADADLFQLLWCPMDHPPSEWTRAKTFWRKSADVSKQLETIPKPRLLERGKYAERLMENLRAGRREDTYADYEYIPKVCRLYPERVVEYPDVMDLPEESRKRLDAWQPDWSRDREGREDYYKPHGVSYFYQSELSTCPGTKVGGYVSWIQSPEVPTCSCGQKMEHLLTVASGEFDRGSWRRWLAIEDRTAFENFEANPRKGTPTPWNYGLMLGDVGSIYYFVCRRCPNLPVKAVTQCS